MQTKGPGTPDAYRDHTAVPGPAPGQAEGTGPPPGLNLELLVHGVGGTTPEEMLGDPRTERITGDRTAAVHRRPDDVDAESRPQDYRDEPVAEAYCWANLTSGNGARALWLILLPFMVVNLAHWARPAADGRRTAVRVHGVVVRLLALSLTVLLVAAACEVALDLVAWQCAGTAACVAEHSWLGFMGVDSSGGGGWWSQPGRRLALAAVVPALLTGLLWWLSHRTWAAYESQPPLRRENTDAERGTDRARVPLAEPGFWYGRRLVARLRAAHTAAGFLTVAAGVAAAATRYDRKPGGSALLDALGWLTEALVVAASLWVLYVVCRRGRKERRKDDALDRLTVTALPGIALGVLLLAVVHACLSRPGWESAGRELPGDETFGVLAVVQGTLAVGLGGLGLFLHRRRPVPRTVLRGLGAAAIALLACGLGGVMSGGVAQRVADWLDGEGTPGMGNGRIQGPPTMLTWQASILPVLLGVLLVLLGWFAYRLWRSSGLLTEEVDRSYPEVSEGWDASRSRRIGGAIARAGLTDSAPWLVGFIALVSLLLGTAAVLGTWLTQEVPGRAADGMPDVVDGFADTVQALGSWLIGFGFLLFLALGRRAYQDPSARRTIGILWDVGTFWPRAAHPFSPPCYAERAVPDLAWRMATWTKATGGRLVISGHSQGSVLAAAAVWHLEPATRGQVAMLTYGSPLERLYGRWFPAYFGPDQLRALHEELHCWRNLWRLTDPIGGPVAIRGAVGESGAEGERPDVDRGPLLDPLAYGRTVTHPLPAPILGHGEYQADPAFDEERDQLLHRLRQERRTEPGVPHQPGEPEPAPGEGRLAQGSAGTSSA
ncbi:hypothetical protein [Streptomyces sp. HNM0574]|uniref:hypothetical protein n=1 Tax=Streptomyces sp. HNM0574 TaxID=2714954 RepID=UPI001F0DB5FB|nr:hypothetical protein [Streptomyces sp. HNM0574]